MVIIKLELSSKHISELRNSVLSNLGYKNNISPGKDIEKVLAESINSLAESANAMGIYSVVKVIAVKKKEVVTEAGSIRSPMFARLAELCKGDKSVVFMIATIGDEWKRSQGHDDSVLRQLLFDITASEASELVAELVETRWRDEAESRRLRTSFRFSPGYCDWDLKEQGVIFKSLDARKIGVQLTKHFVMVPEKTVSAVALIAKEVPAKAPCVFCAKDCAFRRLPFQADQADSHVRHSDT